MNLSDKLETIDCRRDDKARRVSNVAPDTVANVTVDQLEAGMTLEALEALNVPVYRYGTQVTIHGKLPTFDSSARPGGYKAIFQNGNGSIGVRYGAIDAEKKALLSRAARVGNSGFSVSINSTGCEVMRSFHVSDEAKREQIKAECIAALRTLPVARFFGSASAGCLAYGMGYYIAAYVGAIPANEVWPLIADLFNVQGESDLIARENAKEAAQEVRRAEWEAQHEKDKAERQAKVSGIRATLGKPLTVHPQPGESFRMVDSFTGDIKTRVLSGTVKRTYCQVTHLNGVPVHPDLYPRKVIKSGWPKALERGELFPA